MRPKIMTSRSISRSLYYNEQKVSLCKAECITAANFLKDLPRLTLDDKLHCFQRRMELNERVRTSLHITLNFDPSDKLSNAQMKQISLLYMKEIGFEKQPYLVYRHHDAGHPHCHIVTTHIRKDGSPIDLFNIGRNQSEKARQHIETEFGLTTTEMKQQIWQEKQKLDGVQRIRYGEMATTRSVSSVLKHVTENYKYTSLEDLNTILRLYNVEAYRGKENSQLYKHRGLLYRVLDEHGQYIGVPLKASFFDFKPTLANLEKKFVLNQSLKEQLKEYLSIGIQWELFQNPHNLDRAMQKLEQEQIHMVFKRDKTGLCKEVSYVDFRNRCVFNGNDLGKYCNSSAINHILNQQKIFQETLKHEDLDRDLKQVHRQRLRL